LTALGYHRIGEKRRGDLNVLVCLESAAFWFCLGCLDDLKGTAGQWLENILNQFRLEMPGRIVFVVDHISRVILYSRSSLVYTGTEADVTRNISLCVAFQDRRILRNPGISPCESDSLENSTGFSNT
jgi:hypothetical protein